VQTLTQPASVWDTKRWLCNSVDDLEEALEEYHMAEEPGPEETTEELLDCLQCDRLGDSMCMPEAGLCPQKRDRLRRIYAQNQEIKRAMPYLQAKDLRADTHHAALIRSYYLAIPAERRTPRHMERRGWTETARMLGAPVPKCSGTMRCRVPGDTRNNLLLCHSEACERTFRLFEEDRCAAIKAFWRTLLAR
jgi:hypothetical protein